MGTIDQDTMQLAQIVIVAATAIFLLAGRLGPRGHRVRQVLAAFYCAAAVILLGYALMH